MYFLQNMIKIANKPSWSVETTIEGQKGYWIQKSSKNYPLFILSKSEKIYLPKSLRGKLISQIRDSDLETVDKNDNGNVHYQLWKKDLDSSHEKSKLWNGTELTPIALTLLERLRKFFHKNKLDDVKSLGLDSIYSLNLDSFTSMMHSSDLNEIQKIGKVLAKKYRIIVQLLQKAKKSKLTTRLDIDFLYHWNKLNPLFQFDPMTYAPPQIKSVEVPSTKPDIKTIKSKYLAQIEPFIVPQMAGYVNFLNRFSQAIDKNDILIARKAYENMRAELDRLIHMSDESHQVNKNAKAILGLPIANEVYALLFNDHTFEQHKI